MPPQLIRKEEKCECLCLLITFSNQTFASLQVHWYYFVIYHSSCVKWCSVYFSSKQFFVVVVITPVIFRHFFINSWERCCNRDGISRENIVSQVKYHCTGVLPHVEECLSGCSPLSLGPILLLRKDNLSYFWLHRFSKSLHAFSWLRNGI